MEWGLKHTQCVRQLRSIKFSIIKNKDFKTKKKMFVLLTVKLLLVPNEGDEVQQTSLMEMCPHHKLDLVVSISLPSNRTKKPELSRVVLWWAVTLWGNYPEGSEPGSWWGTQDLWVWEEKQTSERTCEVAAPFRLTPAALMHLLCAVSFQILGNQLSNGGGSSRFF